MKPRNKTSKGSAACLSNSSGLQNKSRGLLVASIMLLSVATPLVGECGGSMNLFKGTFDSIRVWLNMFKGHDDALKYAAEDQKRLIDYMINDELHERPPSGYITKGYSRKIWDVSWNNYINLTYKEEEDPSMKKYRGPTGAEFIRYMIKTRREKGLPEIKLEERNKPIIEEIGIQ